MHRHRCGLDLWTVAEIDVESHENFAEVVVVGNVVCSLETAWTDTNLECAEGLLAEADPGIVLQRSTGAAETMEVVSA